MTDDASITSAVARVRDTYQRLLGDPSKREMVLQRTEVLGRYGPLFRDPRRLARLTADELRAFLRSDNNKHWPLHRQGPRLTQDMPALRSALGTLTDEDRPLAERFDAARRHPGLGPALASAVLLVAYPDRYGVWNATSESALGMLDLMPTFARGVTDGRRYVAINEVLLRLAAASELTLWDLDAVFWHLAPGRDDDSEREDATTPSNEPAAAQPRRVWAIYVGERASGNFVLGLQRKAWGGAKRESFAEVAAGDGVVFVHQIEADEPKPKGFPRVSDAAAFRGRAARVVYATVTRGFYEDATPLWPDGAYPWRFDFEVDDDQSSVHVSTDELPESFVDALRVSAIAGGNPPKLAYLVDFGPWSDAPSPDAALEPAPVTEPDAIVRSFSDALRLAGIEFGEGGHLDVVRAFVTALMAKPFVILTGLSGSGKTQIALKLGQWLGASSPSRPGAPRHLLVPVRPDWTGPEHLLGYEDALRKPLADGRRPWVVPEPLRFVLRAHADPTWPHLLVLDEMNLAHVERYFADVLSGMESREPFLPNLVEVEGAWVRDPEMPSLRWPDNLFVVGTVNVDETTYMFSPKVLDRASTLEMRVPTDAMPTDVASVVRPTACAPGPVEFVRGLLAVTRDGQWHVDRAPTDAQDVVQRLHALHRLLAEHGLEFGHRTFYEVVRLSALLASAGAATSDERLDAILLQKILPRLHGVRRKIEPVLLRLGALAATGADVPAATWDPNAPPKDGPRLPRSYAKLVRMMRSLRANQFVSFAE